MAAINIKQFDPATIKPYRIIYFIGRRGTGKSTLVRDIMYHLRNSIDRPVAITPTEESRMMFEDHMPESCVHSSWNPSLMTKIVDKQRRDCKKKKPLKHVMVVMDDCMADKSIFKGPSMRDVFMNGRHLHITFINAMQYSMELDISMRSQIDVVFALRENIPVNKMKLYKYFFGGFETYADFSTVFDACTENNECLVIDNTVKSNNIADMVFWYKAKLDNPPFVMGEKALWNLHYKYFRSDEEMDKIREERGSPNEDKKQKITIVSKTKANSLVNT
jgi:energy-coupling factor transporter ATP-binding protein EcfA2